jgi:citrate lyase beta subunit
MTARFLELGASLYVPATRPDLAALANRRKYPFLRSVIFCTEDAVADKDVPRALSNLECLLRDLDPNGLLRFVRVRNPHILRTLLQMDGVEALTGFVLPKVTRLNLEEYFGAFRPLDHFDLMLTLETIDVFDPRAMAELRDLLLREPFRRRILSLRIGGNDLFNLLGMRRPRGRTVYQTPLGVTIDHLVTTFRPHNFNLTAPVFEYINSRRVLEREVRHDLAHGLFGKTAIHPNQVRAIEANYAVAAADLQVAEEILAHAAPPVFRFQGAMCEPATHRRWAALIAERARIYGVVGDLQSVTYRSTL